jgi:hypothetical protein
MRNILYAKLSIQDLIAALKMKFAYDRIKDCIKSSYTTNHILACMKMVQLFKIKYPQEDSLANEMLKDCTTKYTQLVNRMYEKLSTYTR